MGSPRSLATGLLLALFCASASAQAPVPRIRGTVEKFQDGALTVKTREGPSMVVKFGEKFGVLGVVPAALADIGTGKFVGIATLGTKDGAPVALEVLIFPDNMKGAGEGHYGWDLKPGSMMTNATVEGVVLEAKDRLLTLKYKDGEQKILVPEACPVVTFVPSDAGALKPGAHVFISRPARAADGSITAAGVAVGLNGLVPPM
ncbi:MAG: hypothetical protein ACRET8_10170 [Burkholderiales bacterium]